MGAILVIALVITPGATAYLLTDQFKRLLIIAILIGFTSSALGAYISYFINGATGGIIVTLQTLIFLYAFFFPLNMVYLLPAAKRDKKLYS